jgi:hypothetical protein
MVSDSEHRESEVPTDPSVSDYDKEVLASLREAFPWPYSVHKVKEGSVNEAKLTWNPIFGLKRKAKAFW